MNKTIFSVIKNNDGKVMEVIYKYLDTDALRESLISMLQEERDKFCSNEEDMHGWYYDDDQIEEYVDYLVDSFNKNMDMYLHGEHTICGNFNNIDYDYNKCLFEVSDGKYGKDEIEYNCQGVKDMIERLDNGEDSELADFERKALLSWFWETFGSWGICYNFNDHLSSGYDDYCYCNDIEMD